MKTYSVAFTTEAGDWDIVETFEAESSANAEAYAEANYADRDWYVLDEHGNNINA